MEIEFYLLMALIGSLGFCIGSFVAPINHHLKSHIKFIEGKMSRYKQELEGSKKSQGVDGAAVEGILEGDLSISNIYKVLKNLTPEQIAQGKELLGQIKGKAPTKEAGPGVVEWR